ncbi:hypothetical protein [Candidatus Venteria ishoeyi]|uniref:Uncharacterized protein n=1 Tax=Candidatus Venteria ishoeyi TaxID=1899563 RepID=A0A1H6F9J6_9GAMM|nr:hypothetical protein [Candidatus Venteria ishoeyi]SEH06772.1 Uncharacterised protein [Candidatus Venteria ishoeyi]
MNIRPDILQSMDTLDVQQRTEAESLVNAVLEAYVLRQTQAANDAQSLLGLAGLFDSQYSQTSTQVKSTVTAFILNKYAH